MGVSTPLAEHWDGTSWAVQPVPFPADSSNAQTRAVSCASPTSCTAVGVYFLPGKDSQFPLAEHWDGTSWAVQQVPLPASAFEAQLTGVSCPSATTCIAVGYYNTPNDVPFAEQWNGTTWTAQAVPGQTGDSLSAISCTSPTACTAVGGGLAERWNGTTWTAQAIPGGGELTAVSCPSATSCTAAGFTGLTLPDGVFTGVGVVDGTGWTEQETPPTPTDAAPAPDTLNEVSCRSATYCTAIGIQRGSGFGFTGHGQPLAIHE
jgi:hypothetical protein